MNPGANFETSMVLPLGILEKWSRALPSKGNLLGDP